MSAKSLRVWSWWITGLLTKQKKIILVGISLGIVLALFSLWILPYIPRPTPVTRIGLIGQYRLDSLPGFVASKVGQGLTAILRDGSPAPALASDWAVSGDGKVYTFFIRDNLYWQDGTPVTARDMSYNFTDVVTEILDDFTVRFTLEDVFTPFPNLLAEPILKDKIIGTGEYIISNFEEKGGFIQQLTLENAREKIRIKFYPGLSMAVEAFKLGEIDEIHEVSNNPFANQKPWLQAIEETKQTIENQYLALFLNNDDPMLVDKSFRQALAYATQKIEGKGRVISPISADSWGYNPDVKPYDYDPKRAKELLEKSIGSLDRAKDITITISTTQAFIERAEAVKKDWEQTLEIKVDITLINSLSSDFQVLLATQEMPSDPDQYPLWHSTQEQNIVHFNNPRIDKFLEDARRQTDQEIRKELYLEFQRFFIEECPVIFLSHPERYSIKRKSVLKPLLRQVLEFGKT